MFYKKYRSLIYIIPLPSVQCVGKKRTVIGKALMNVTIVSDSGAVKRLYKGFVGELKFYRR
jgi:hypothetical protein